MTGLEALQGSLIRLVIIIMLLVTQREMNKKDNMVWIYTNRPNISWLMMNMGICNSKKLWSTMPNYILRRLRNFLKVKSGHLRIPSNSSSAWISWKTSIILIALTTIDLMLWRKLLVTRNITSRTSNWRINQILIKNILPSLKVHYFIRNCIQCRELDMIRWNFNKRMQHQTKFLLQLSLSMQILIQ